MFRKLGHRLAEAKSETRAVHKISFCLAILLLLGALLILLLPSMEGRQLYRRLCLIHAMLNSGSAVLFVGVIGAVVLESFQV